jgi:hypothetical protein
MTMLITGLNVVIEELVIEVLVNVNVMKALLELVVVE